MKLSRTANDCARAITKHIEKEVGKDLTLETCMKVVACIQLAMNTAVEARAAERADKKKKASS